MKRELLPSINRKLHVLYLNRTFMGGRIGARGRNKLGEGRDGYIMGDRDIIL